MYEKYACITKYCLDWIDGNPRINGKKFAESMHTTTDCETVSSNGLLEIHGFLNDCNG